MLYTYNIYNIYYVVQIEDLITSIGGGLDTDMLVREFDERMHNVQLTQGNREWQLINTALHFLSNIFFVFF